MVAECLGAALGLWRGTPLADVPSEALARKVLPELDRRRAQAAEWRADAELRLGKHEDLVLDLQELTTEYPLRERFHAQLMLALYRSGRAAEALAAFEHARQTLARQLGADPGSELRGLHERILRNDPALTTSHGTGTKHIRCAWSPPCPPRAASAARRARSPRHAQPAVPARPPTGQ